MSTYSSKLVYCEISSTVFRLEKYTRRKVCFLFPTRWGLTTCGARADKNRGAGNIVSTIYVSRDNIGCNCSCNWLQPFSAPENYPLAHAPASILFERKQNIFPLTGTRRIGVVMGKTVELDVGFGKQCSLNMV